VVKGVACQSVVVEVAIAAILRGGLRVVVVAE
jgi:hypothetical protein